MFPVTILLHEARFPHEVSLLRAWVMLPGLAVLLRPVRNVPAEGWVAYVALHAAGLAYVSAWIARYLELYQGWAPPAAWGLLALASFTVSLGRYLVLRMLSHAWNRREFMCRLMVVLTISLADVTVSRLLPWYEAVGIVYSCAEFSIVSWFVQLCGVEFACPVTVGLALFFLNSPARVLGRLALPGLLSLAFSQQARQVLGSEVVHIIGVQHPRADSVDLSHVSVVDGDFVSIVVYPEGACRDACKTPLRGFRVAGVRQSLIGDGNVMNVVAVELGGVEGRKLIGSRAKHLLAPLGEAKRVVAGQVLNQALVAEGISIAAPICYEIFDRSLIYGMGGALGVSVSRDFFDGSGSASMYMSKAAWLRSLELHVPFVRVSDTFGSVAYDGEGRLIDVLGRGAGRLDVLVVVDAIGRSYLQSLIYVFAGAWGLMLILIRHQSEREFSPTSGCSAASAKMVSDGLTAAPEHRSQAVVEELGTGSRGYM